MGRFLSSFFGTLILSSSLVGCTPIGTAAFYGQNTLTSAASPSAPAKPSPSPTPSTPAPAPTPPSDTTTGKVALYRTQDSASDALLSQLMKSDAMKTLWDQLFDHMLVYTPSFDQASFRYVRGQVYQDLYAIYTDGSQPDAKDSWILRDASGNKLFIPWGCANGTCPQYAANIWSEEYRQWWISVAAATFARGHYSGLFVDDSTLEFRVSNVSGKSVAPVVNGKTMSSADWMSAVVSFVSEIRAAFPDKEIVNNGAWYMGSDSNFQDATVRAHIATGDYYLMEFGINDSGVTGGSGLYSVAQQLKFIQAAHEVGTHVILGSVPTDVAGKEYALAYYFLYKQEKDLLKDQSVLPGSTPWAGYAVDLGIPQGAFYIWHNLRRRDFAKGVVLFNEPNATAQTVSLPGYQDLNGASGSFQIPAKSGKILLTALAGNT